MQPPNSAFEPASFAVIAIHRGTRAQHSGTLLGPDLVITVSMGIETEGEEFEIHSVFGLQGKFPRPARVLTVDDGTGYMLLGLESPVSGAVPEMTWSKQVIEPGQPWESAVGGFFNGKPTFAHMRGAIESLEPGVLKLLVLGGPFGSGVIGSPVVSRGQLVGIIGSLAEPRGKFFAVATSIQVLCEGPFQEHIQRWRASHPLVSQQAEPAPLPANHPEVPAPGFRSDDLRGDDLLKLHREVAALVSVVAAEDVPTPLSLGLFGDWGSGKSFFMQKMKERIDKLTKRKVPGYCQEIVQIHFNAWHYIDTANLWASFASEIFEQLASKLAERDGEAGLPERTRLLAAAASSRDVLAEALKQKEAAEAELRSSEEQLVRLDATGAQLEAGLAERELYRSAFRSAFQQVLGDKQLQERLTTAADKLGLPMGSVLAEDLKKLVEAPGFLKAFWVSVSGRASRERRSFLLLTLLFLAVPAAAGLGLSKLMAMEPVWIAVLGPLAGLLVRFVPYLKMAHEALAPLKEAHQSTEALLAGEKERQRKAMEQQKSDFVTKVLEARNRVEEAQASVRKLEAQLDALKADRQLADFIRQRHASTDYTQHLGVIARAHQDFERLSKYLQGVRKQLDAEASGKEGAPTRKQDLPRIDRIILYIDDLDRCPENKVVEVLQAVHLLLAFELFVVVVGVDSRWLLHSLRQHSRVFQASLQESTGMSDEDRHHWQSTPLNYLEKIFQIPYALQPMNEEGFSNLIDDLAKAQPQRNPQRGVVPTKTDSKGAEQQGGEATESPVPSVRGAIGSLPQPASSPPVPPETTTELDESLPEPLELAPWERDVMKALHALIPSPRAAKRFVNTYRLLHASLEPAERARFIGDERQGGYRPALLLLAMLVGHPSETAHILETLVEQQPPAPWWTFIDTFAPRCEGKGLEAEGWKELMARLERIRTQNYTVIPEAQPSGDFLEWARSVCRYSFHARAVLLASRDTVSAPPRVRAASAAVPEVTRAQA